jgi:hypothetical protein
MLAQARQQASQLLLAVTTDALEADAALLAWPRLADPSLHTAYQALLHFSVDQAGNHQTQPLYADVQLQWLATLANQLAMGQPLPYASHAGYCSPVRFYWRTPVWVVWFRQWFSKIAQVAKSRVLNR